MAPAAERGSDGCAARVLLTALWATGPVVDTAALALLRVVAGGRWDGFRRWQQLST
jgi:hypothetical protein